jgi:uncharacterized protein
MRDRIVRRSVKRIALVCFTVSLRASRWQCRQEGATPYDLGGSCQGCGTCCEAPAIRVGRAIWYLPTLRRVFLWWHETVNRFHLQSTASGERTFVFTCDHFDWSGRRCDSYESRPGMCRDYPRALLDQPAPVLFPRCGYRALAVHRRELVEILDRQNLAAERLDKLKADLYLNDD